jgi:hypothetical protein
MFISTQDKVSNPKAVFHHFTIAFVGFGFETRQSFRVGFLAVTFEVFDMGQTCMLRLFNLSIGGRKTDGIKYRIVRKAGFTSKHHVTGRRAKAGVGVSAVSEEHVVKVFVPLVLTIRSRESG